jgi:hypothetical protein
VNLQKHQLGIRPDLIILDDMEDDMAEEITGTTSCTPNVSGGRLWFTGPETTACHQVKIDKVVNGFVVEIGCKKFVAEKWEDLAKKLAEYWKDPVAAQKKYVK